MESSDELEEKEIVLRTYGPKINEKLCPNQGSLILKKKLVKEVKSKNIN